MSAAPSYFPTRDDIGIAEALLGLLLIHGEPAYSEAALFASAEDFAVPLDKVFAAICDLAALGMSIDPLTVKAKIGAALDAFGGVQYLANLVQAAPAASDTFRQDVGSYARMVRDATRRRRIDDALADAREKLKSASTPLSEAVRSVSAACDAIHDQSAPSASTSESGIEMAAELERAYFGERVPSVPTGIATLDQEMGGLYGGELVIAAGRPGMGKTALLLSIAYRAALAGHPVIFFSLEMRRKPLLQRLACDIDYDRNANLPCLLYTRCRTPQRLGRGEIQRYAEAMIDLPPNLHIYDDGGMTAEKISAISRKHAQGSYRIGLVVVDYLQKIAASDRYKGQRVQEVTETAGSLKTLAMNLDWPVVAGCQLNRAVEGRTDKFPTLSDLRESGAIEQDADIVIGLYREAYYLRQILRGMDPMDTKAAALETKLSDCKNRLDISLLKFRQGSDETYELFCDIGANVVRSKGHRRGDGC